MLMSEKLKVKHINSYKLVQSTWNDKSSHFPILLNGFNIYKI